MRKAQEAYEESLVLDKYRKVYRRQEPDWVVNLAKHLDIGDMDTLCRAVGQEIITSVTIFGRW